MDAYFPPPSTPESIKRADCRAKTDRLPSSPGPNSASQAFPSWRPPVTVQKMGMLFHALGLQFRQCFFQTFRSRVSSWGDGRGGPPVRNGRRSPGGSGRRDLSPAKRGTERVSNVGPLKINAAIVTCAIHCA